MEHLSAPAARRIALAAQGFGAARPSGSVTMRHVHRELVRLGQFQIDSINVAVRAHYMPAFSRLGPYDASLIPRLTQQPPRRAFEFWGHAAAVIDVDLEPALRYRMSQAAAEAWSGMRRVERDHPGLVERVLREVSERGPISAREIESDEVRCKDNWGWNWSAVKTALEWLLRQGRVMAADRNSAFERRYDLPERVLPPHILARPTPDPDESHRILVRRAAAALGVATPRCLGQYFYLKQSAVRTAVADLVDAEELLPTHVDGWGPAYLWSGARHPRAIRARALVSPFDSLVFQRERLLGLFGSHYRIEIYVPAAQRRFGYYVYPFLLDDQFVARVDLKADRRADALLVQAAWREPDREARDGYVASELAAELRLMASWLGLSDVIVVGRGDLAPALAAATRREERGSDYS